MSTDLLARLSSSLVDGDPDAVVALTREAIATDVPPMTIIDGGLLAGMSIVGEKYSCGEYFLPHLIVAANAMKQAMALVEPELRRRQQVFESAGTVVIGTVKGDIHEIGKSLVGTMLSAHGFTVHDLGVDVPIERFVSAAREHDATLVGMSALLTTTMGGQRKVIEALTAAGLRDRVKVMVGGAPVSERWAEQIGADGYAEDAVAAVALARRLVGAGNG